ncbi:MAG: glutamate synthase [Rickettsiales bacterium]|nr:glutamate synthase [Rickettsiales bacterium]|tara:strand:+ start:61 stop:648 length:588 start_codon:yes stop_codon:yes gene_type:complete
MKQCIKLVLVAASLFAASVAQADEAKPDFLSDARSVVMIFQKSLKQELMSAMQSGGPKKAVELCHSRAPAIAEEIGKKTGWEIGRTALKTRNEKNLPSEAEREVLENFEQRKEKGESIDKLEWWQKQDNTIAYMKAIPMSGMCASCHGSNVRPSLKQHINQFYPHDMATGFKVGDIRGAFTLKRYLKGAKGSEAP